MNKTYRVMKYKQKGTPSLIRTGLTLEQAQEICNDDESSSMTAKLGCNGKEKTIAKWHELEKHWFYGYEEN